METGREQGVDEDGELTIRCSSTPAALDDTSRRRDRGRRHHGRVPPAAVAAAQREPADDPRRTGAVRRRLVGRVTADPAGETPAPRVRRLVHRAQPPARAWPTTSGARGAARGWRSLSYQFMRSWDLNGRASWRPTASAPAARACRCSAASSSPRRSRPGASTTRWRSRSPRRRQRRSTSSPRRAPTASGASTSLPEGARIRLKAGISLRTIQRRFTDLRCRNPLFGLRSGRRSRLCRNYRFLPRTNQVAAAAIITALRRYGAIVVDRARVPTLYAKFNADWTRPLRSAGGALLDERGRPFLPGRRREPTPLLRGNEVQGLRLADFEVIRLGQRFRYPQLGTIIGRPAPGRRRGPAPGRGRAEHARRRPRGRPSSRGTAADGRPGRRRRARRRVRHRPADGLRHRHGRGEPLRQGRGERPRRRAPAPAPAPRPSTKPERARCPSAATGSWPSRGPPSAR